MTSEVATYLKYADLQIAAEALFDQKGLGPDSKFSGLIRAGVLTTGNERSSKFTQVQADEFIKDWTVVEHVTYTFNGAGVGAVAPGSTLAQVMDDFTRHRGLGSNADLFANSPWLASYQRFKDIFKEGASVTLAQIDEALGELPPSPLVAAETKILYEALHRIRSVVYEADRINAGVPSGTDGAAALPVSKTDIAAIGLDYQLAAYRAAEKTASYRTGAIVCRQRRNIKSIAACAYSKGATGKDCSRIWSRRHA